MSKCKQWGRTAGMLHRSIPGHQEDKKITKEISTRVFPLSLAQSPPEDQVPVLEMGPILHKRMNISYGRRCWQPARAALTSSGVRWLPSFPVK